MNAFEWVKRLFGKRESANVSSAGGEPAARYSREDDSTDVTRLYRQMRTAAGYAEDATKRAEKSATRASTRMSTESYDRMVAALGEDEPSDGQR